MVVFVFLSCGGSAHTVPFAANCGNSVSSKSSGRVVFQKYSEPKHLPCKMSSMQRVTSSSVFFLFWLFFWACHGLSFGWVFWDGHSERGMPARVDNRWVKCSWEAEPGLLLPFLNFMYGFQLFGGKKKQNLHLANNKIPPSSSSFTVLISRANTVNQPVCNLAIRCGKKLQTVYMQKPG